MHVSKFLKFFFPQIDGTLDTAGGMMLLDPGENKTTQ